MTFAPDAIIYHFPCPDGFASAYVAHQRWPEADLIPTNYGKPFKFEELKGKAVLIVDFSFPLDQLLGLAAMCNGVLVLDHHKTAAEALAVVPAPNSHRADECIVEPEQLRAWFDMEHSGVSMTWAFCFGSQPDDPPNPMPDVFAAIGDRDLWRFELEHTEEISAAVRSYPYDFVIWKERLLKVPTETLILDGKAIARFIDRLVDDIASHAKFRMLQPADWIGVPVVNCPPQLSSEVGHRLLTLHPSAPFAATYSQGDGIRTWRLRSTDKRTDVSVIARKFGGGGHRNAADFKSVID
jgi:oligoribonuclease NrnB/cAMP/cGMP phosphodiesterase (DHH superfamily)